MSAPRVPTDAVAPLCAAAVVLVLVAVLIGLLLAARRGHRRDVARNRAETEALQRRIETLEERLAPARAVPAGTSPGTAPSTAPGTVSGTEDRAPVPTAGEFVITRLGEPDAREDEHAGATGPVVAPVGGKLFADLVLREGVVQAAALAAGVRRALAPETRARIRIEMRREVKRSRRARRTHLRQLRQEAAARDRAGAGRAA